jgi:hypothetical protein
MKKEYKNKMKKGYFGEEYWKNEYKKVVIDNRGNKIS